MSGNCSFRCVSLVNTYVIITFMPHADELQGVCRDRAETDQRGGFLSSRAVPQRRMGEEDSARQGQCSRDGSERRIPRVKGSAAETDGRGEFPERRIPHLKAVPQRQIREEDSPPQWQCSRNGDSSDSKTAAPRGRRVRGDGMHADTHAVLRRDSSLMVYGSVS